MTCQAIPSMAEVATDGVTETTPSLERTYRRAKSAYDANQFDACKQILRSAGNLTPVMLVLMAQAECELGEFRACATHASVALRSSEHKPEKRKAIEEMRAEAAREVGWVWLSVNVPDADVFIDGRRLGETPIEIPIYLDPGTHNVSVEKSGYVTMTREIEAQRGVEIPLALEMSERPRTGAGSVAHPTLPTTGSLVLTTPARSPVTQGPAREPPSLPGSRPNTAVLVAGGLVTVGGLVVGIYLNARANSEFDHASGLKVGLPAGACASNDPATRADCSSLKDRLANGDRARNYSTVGLVLGGAALVGTAAYWLWPRNHAQAAIGGLRWTGSLGPRLGWLGVENVF